MAKHLPNLREELCALMYELALVPIEGKSLEEHFRIADSLSMWWCSLLFEKHPYMLPKLYPALKLRALERLLIENNCVYDNIILHIADPALKLALKDFCAREQKNFACTVQKRFSFSAKLNLKKCFQKLPYAWQKLLRFGHWLWKMRHILLSKPACLDANNSKSDTKMATIATYFPHMHTEKANQGIFRSHYFESLHDLLNTAVQNNALRIQWLLIRINSTHPNFEECQRTKENLQNTGQAFAYLEEFLDLKSIAIAYLRSVRLALRSKKLQKNIAPRFCLGRGNMSLWPYLKEYWQESFQGWRGLERLLQRQAFCNYGEFLSLKKQRDTNFSHAWTLFPAENCPWERMLTEVMHRAKLGTVIAYQHASVRAADFRYYEDKRIFENHNCAPFLPHIYALNGQSAGKSLEHCLAHDRIIIVEALRYLHLNALPALPDTFINKPVTELVLIASYFAEEVDIQIRTLASWLSLYGEKNRIMIHIKAHPHCPVLPFLQKYGIFLEEQTLLKMETQPLDEIFAQLKNPLLWFANSTTACIEGAYLGFPLVVQKAENTFDMCPLSSLPKEKFICTADELQLALTAQNYPHNLQAQPMDMQNYFCLHSTLERWKSLLALA